MNAGAAGNIAYGYRTPSAVVNGWLNSPGHRANIESASYKSIGVGAAGTTTMYWAQNFGTSTAAASPPPPPPPLPTPPPANDRRAEQDRGLVHAHRLARELRQRLQRRRRPSSVRVHCTRSDTVAFTKSGDLMRVTFTKPS